MRYTHCGEGLNACGCGYKDFVMMKLKGIFEWIACGYGVLNGLRVDMDTDMVGIWMWIQISIRL